MPRFIRDSLIFIVLQTVLVVLLIHFFYEVRLFNPLSPATVLKHKRLTDAPSPRMILIGGSNLLFGIDSAMIEQQTAYHPVNMGLVGGLRLEFIINEIDAQLRPGDLVVMSLEYNTLNATPNTDEGQVIMGVAMQRPANLRFATWPQWKRLLDQGALTYLGVVFRQAFANIVIPAEDHDDPDVNTEMNVYGDLTRYHDPAVKPRKPNHQRTLVKIKPEGVATNLARMNAFIASCRERGVDVVFSWPPLPHTHYEKELTLARRFNRALREGLDAPVLGRPEDMVFPDRDFIGLSYHLRGEAVQQRTQRLIDAVKRWRESAASRPGAGTSPDSSQPNG